MTYGYKKEVRINLTPNLMTLADMALFFDEKRLGEPPGRLAICEFLTENQEGFNHMLRIS